MCQIFLDMWYDVRIVGRKSFEFGRHKWVTCDSEAHVTCHFTCLLACDVLNYLRLVLRKSHTPIGDMEFFMGRTRAGMCLFPIVLLTVQYFCSRVVKKKTARRPLHKKSRGDGKFFIRSGKALIRPQPTKNLREFDNREIFRIVRQILEGMFHMFLSIVPYDFINSSGDFINSPKRTFPFKQWQEIPLASKNLIGCFFPDFFQGWKNMSFGVQQTPTDPNPPKIWGTLWQSAIGIFFWSSYGFSKACSVWSFSNGSTDSQKDTSS